MLQIFNLCDAKKNVILRVSPGEGGHVFTRKSKIDNGKNRVWKIATKRGWNIRKNRR